LFKDSGDLETGATAHVKMQYGQQKLERNFTITVMDVPTYCSVYYYIRKRENCAKINSKIN